MTQWTFLLNPCSEVIGAIGEQPEKTSLQGTQAAKHTEHSGVPNRVRKGNGNLTLYND